MKILATIIILFFLSGCKTWELNRGKDFKSPFKRNLYDDVKNNFPRHWHHPDYK